MYGQEIYGQEPMDNIVKKLVDNDYWTSICGQAFVDKHLWTSICGQELVDKKLRTRTCIKRRTYGQESMDNNL